MLDSCRLKRFLAVPLILLGCLLPWLVSAQTSLAEGAFNEAQAIRGQALYYQHCLDCHGEAMGGVDKAPPLAGPQFAGTWNNAPLAALVARILTMPPEKPGTLTHVQSVDVLTYILWYNGMPLGDQELGSAPAILAQTKFHSP